jgi:hypothetical protein
MTKQVIEILTTFSNGNIKAITEVECSRCSGNGRLAAYRNIDNGKCFKCGGTGVEKKEVKIMRGEKYNMIKETTAIKPMVKVNDDEAMRRSMIQTNEERKVKHQQFQDLLKKEQEEQAQHEEDMKNNPEDYTFSFSWDD